MPRFVAFLRGINVGRGRSLKMETLRRIFETLGFSGVSTVVASGNVVFSTEARDVHKLEGKIEATLQEELGYEVATFIRTEAELAGIAAYQPFPPAEVDPAAELYIVFLGGRLDEKVEQRLLAQSTHSDQFRVHGREIYWQRRRQPGVPFSSVPLEKAIGSPFTVRGSKTVRKIAAKLEV